MKIGIIIFIVMTFASKSIAQEELPINNSSFSLVDWEMVDCDDTYDPHRLINRITNIESNKGVLSITVNFSDNCCPEFQPKANFENNRLRLLPYDELHGGCFCECCFSIIFHLKGIKSDSFEVYFKDEKIELSDDHYATVEPSFKVYKGQKINQTNKYGFREGLWLSFFEDGTAENVVKYPDVSLYYESEYEWAKRYFASGNLAFYSRNDTIESWFEDGELRFQEIKYPSGDSAFEKGFSKYENRQLQRRFLYRGSPSIDTSEFDSTYRINNYSWGYVYEEKYFPDGMPEYITGGDTSYTWFEDGTIKIKKYKGGVVEFSEEGYLLERTFYWNKPGIIGKGDLDQSLFIEYYNNGEIKRIHFVRDELSKNGNSYFGSNHYYWGWNKDGNLILSPEKWEEDLPWAEMKEVRTP